MTDLIPILTDLIPFLTDLPDLGYLSLVLRHPRLHMLEALHGGIAVSDQTFALGV
ncbi:hypothetical protein PF010_g12904 [Phytophthora fragariae]|uniref:Uncharacterized protein n=1 Tax=Phytophthora fragariae TaxID=53985 RepID=A0A6A3R9F0_9STRA|nr:hypothetical protein PF003_g33910 [Phytophthora fragariae]KAE8926504.1 hypothetical protein PF009_g23307 [Phytophthora fragariae]KAE9091306.1 hypothetical protein PF007_g18929 [Phytophthora fragariae]KAE9105703.1 hypothetical protein PF010_g12904 [Phytophthora fragariae]KAE9139787.1 hypothetical protein PF006_g13669 [Phytophthora fragariae]